MSAILLSQPGSLRQTSPPHLCADFHSSVATIASDLIHASG
ncbi:MAG: hypothetical protein WCJ66_10795 [Verrucomicrobiota bacterium]